MGHSVDEWPKRSAAEITDDARERVKLQRKVFLAAMIRPQIEKCTIEEKVPVAEESSRLDMLSRLIRK